MAGMTNRGKKIILSMAFRAQDEPTNFYVHLLTSSASLSDNTNTFSDVSSAESTGGSYGELTKARGTGFLIAEDDTSNFGQITVPDCAWTASGSAIANARYAIITDDAGGSGGHASNNVLCYWDLGSTQAVSDGATLTLTGFKIKITES
jgi:hypothetical protein|tara:strand:+ start:3528 stop:3974 length:447 start_codon:yes stop_codon:yes gene_type:complete